ncbi:probable WRKY transcription factor 70 [Durio zibethinus]|uniref:Probable WRKY transcription factor 70 n=1 Tax=Durio zibethinus TaxID=66656 RepID=A0A6P5X4X0_DURZI|nr:probable WRKY transcription factor 70 [Durio zibethinus]
MQSAWSENMSLERKKAIEELGRGRELANQLRDLLSKSLGDEGEDLVMKIFNSFGNTLSMLRNSGDYDDEVSQNQRNSINMSWDGRKSEDSEDSIKSTSTQKDRRGCYKRRKCAESWTKDTPALIDDGHAWRKYGQKVIVNANHPRNYYRCTHKVDQGCQATKQVQKIEDHPPKYRPTYYGHHTCKNLPVASHLILDSTSNDSSILLSFANNLTSKHDNPFFLSFPSVKQESKEDHTTSDITYNRSLSSEYLMSPELTLFESSVQMEVLSSDHDVISGVVNSVDLDDLLEFCEVGR